ncbi:MAG: hypothetical protein IKC56_01425 [Clostridia bacterium]|nr:hypothetical protein [Clostridia bacterium]
MHIGAPAIPTVQVGDTVTRGQIIGKAGNGLSVNIHTSLSGTVTAVDGKFVTVKRG